MKKEINPDNSLIEEGKNTNNSTKALTEIAWGVQYQLKVTNHLQKNKKRNNTFSS